MLPIVLNVLLPFAEKWVEEQQAHILKNGVPLTAHQAFDAHLAGVKNPGKVRLMRVDFIPTPEDRSSAKPTTFSISFHR